MCFINENIASRQKINHEYSTRGNTSQKIILLEPNSTTFLKSEDYLGIQLYNILSGKVRNIENNNLFKRKIKQLERSKRVHL